MKHVCKNASIQNRQFSEKVSFFFIEGKSGDKIPVYIYTNIYEYIQVHMFI
jgi:hypothetical protein